MSLGGVRLRRIGRGYAARPDIRFGSVSEPFSALCGAFGSGRGQWRRICSVMTCDHCGGTGTCHKPLCRRCPDQRCSTCSGYGDLSHGSPEPSKISATSVPVESAVRPSSPRRYIAILVVVAILGSVAAAAHHGGRGATAHSKVSHHVRGKPSHPRAPAKAAERVRP